MEGFEAVESGGGMEWMKIISGIAMVLMIIYLFPHAKRMMQASAEVENKDWKGVLIPILFVVLFVVFLISTV